MKVVGKQHIVEFQTRFSDSRAQLSSWLDEAMDANWLTPKDIKQRYSTASFLSDNRVIFNLKGNNYRLDVKISYRQKIVTIIRIGTHAEYSKWKFN